MSRIESLVVGPMYFDKGCVFMVLQIKDIFGKTRIIKIGFDGRTVPSMNL
jgi:hypothetical protein